MATPTTTPRSGSTLTSGLVPVGKRLTPNEEEQKLREEIVRIGRLMFEKRWIAANDGNITIRLDDERILATPSGVSKGMMGPEDLIVCDLEGRKFPESACTTEIRCI